MAKEYKLGNSVVVRLNDGRIVEGKIKAIIRATDGRVFACFLCYRLLPVLGNKPEILSRNRQSKSAFQTPSQKMLKTL